MNWTKITSPEHLAEIKELSFLSPIVIYKHSTRCNISSMALGRLEREYSQTAAANTKFYFLDLLAHRTISNLVAETFDVQHESPQVLLIRNGKCVYDASHMDIRFDELSEQINLATV